jgi:hypothetical protein
MTVQIRNQYTLWVSCHKFCMNVWFLSHRLRKLQLYGFSKVDHGMRDSRRDGQEGETIRQRKRHATCNA